MLFAFIFGLKLCYSFTLSDFTTSTSLAYFFSSKLLIIIDLLFNFGLKLHSFELINCTSSFFTSSYSYLRLSNSFSLYSHGFKPSTNSLECLLSGIGLKVHPSSSLASNSILSFKLFSHDYFYFIPNALSFKCSSIILLGIFASGVQTHMTSKFEFIYNFNFNDTLYALKKIKIDGIKSDKSK